MVAAPATKPAISAQVEIGSDIAITSSRLLMRGRDTDAQDTRLPIQSETNFRTADEMVSSMVAYSLGSPLASG